MSTTTVKTCDFCGARMIPSDARKWGVLVIGPYRQIESEKVTSGYVSGESRDVCPVCIAKMRGAKAVA